MILIVGGRNQGRLGYALSEYNIDKSEVLDCSADSPDGIENAKIIYKIDELIKTVDYDEFLCLYTDRLCDKIVITTETGCGLVPVDKDERLLREKIGRVNCALAKAAERVDRVVCGIGQCIKAVK